MQDLFSTFGVNWSLLIAQVVNFGIVLIALWYFLYKPVMTTLDKRREMIAQSVADAEKAEAMFAGADTEVKTRITNADSEAEAIVTSAREAASTEKARLLKEAENRAAQVTKDAEARATEAISRARKESERDIARLAILAAEKVLQEKHD